MPIEFREPPRAKGGRAALMDHGEVAAALRAHPGEWALIATASSDLAQSVKHARRKAYAPAGSFEATTRARSDGRFDVYARFVGEVSA